MTNPKIWELYAVKYATSINRIRNDNFLNTDPHDSTPMPLDYYIWVATSEDQTIVIDTGFDESEESAEYAPIDEQISYKGIPEIKAKTTIGKILKWVKIETMVMKAGD